jgi:EAL domain-containing protein (putative c-di-GMP-specific phosphodiesterase class I)
MRELNINCIMEQLGFSSSQMENWHSLQAKQLRISSEFVVTNKVASPLQPLIHAASTTCHKQLILN